MQTFKATLIAMIALALMSGCRQQAGESGDNTGEPAEASGEQAQPQLVHQWSTDSVMNVPESVCYDPVNEILYVANIQGKPTEKDGEGFISKLSTEGEVLNLEWVTGLDAPKGMGVHNGKLYVTNIDEIVEIDIEGGTISNRYPLEGSKFANDIAINREGVVFASDMSVGRIYSLKDGNTQIWFESDKLKSPNGLFTTENELMIGIDGAVLKAAYGSDQLTEHIPNTGGIDGLEAVDDQYFIKSDWAGHIHLIHPEKEKLLLLNTADDNIQAADIEYVPELRMLFVPTFHDNRVTAYELKM
jgi:hypothetical protein